MTEDLKCFEIILDKAGVLIVLYNTQFELLCNVELKTSKYISSFKTKHEVRLYFDTFFLIDGDPKELYNFDIVHRLHSSTSFCFLYRRE